MNTLWHTVWPRRRLYNKTVFTTRIWRREQHNILWIFIRYVFPSPPPPYRLLTVSPCIRGYIIIYPRHHYTVSLCLDSRPALDFRLTARAANKVHACRRGGESKGFLRTFIIRYNIYIYAILNLKREAKDLYILYDWDVLNPERIFFLFSFYLDVFPALYIIYKHC